MKKKSYHKDYEEIVVPKEEVFQAIHKGVKHAKMNQKPNHKKHYRKGLISAAAAVILFFSSGFIFPAMSHALSNVPLLGQLYGGFNDSVGKDLETKKLVTRLNQTASSQGITVKITSAYYDGAEIGMTFQADGDLQTDKNGHFRAFYEVFGNDHSITESMETKELADTKTTKAEHTGHIQISYPKQELPANATVPITFKELGDKKGAWKFNVPIKQLPFQTVKMNKVSTSKDKNIKVTFDSVIEGKSSTALNYTASVPKSGKYDQIRLNKIYDDQGKPIQMQSTAMTKSTLINGRYVKKIRTIIPQNLGKTGSITISPEAALYEKDHFIPLDKKMPFAVKSDRQNLSVNIDRLDVKKHSVILDFQFNQGDSHHKDFSFYQDFAKNDVALVKKSEKTIYKKLMSHSVKVLDKGQLKFRSTFHVTSWFGFNPDNYVLRVNMGEISANIPVQLSPVKIELKK